MGLDRNMLLLELDRRNPHSGHLWERRNYYRVWDRNKLGSHKFRPVSNKVRNRYLEYCKLRSGKYNRFRACSKEKCKYLPASSSWVNNRLELYNLELYRVCNSWDLCNCYLAGGCNKTGWSMASNKKECYIRLACNSLVLSMKPACNIHKSLRVDKLRDRRKGKYMKSVLSI